MQKVFFVSIQPVKPIVNYRSCIANTISFSLTIGFLTLLLIAYQAKTSFRNLYKLLSLFPLAYSILLLPFVSESPCWLLIRGRAKEALDVLNKFAILKGKRKLPNNVSLFNRCCGDKNETISEKQ